MSFLEDMIYVNKNVLGKTVKSFTKNWQITLTVVAYTLINILVYNLFNILFAGPFSLLSGIIRTLVNSSIVSSYLYSLFNIISYGRFSLDIFKNGFTQYVRKIYGIFFIGYLGRLLLSLVAPMFGVSAGFITIIVGIMVAFVLNPLPEAVYLKSYGSLDTITYSLEFLKENFVQWFVPNLLFYGVIYLLTGQLLFNLFNTNLEFVFSSNVLDILLFAVGQVIFSFMMVYRGHLFKVLSTSNRRKRMFMRKV